MLEPGSLVRWAPLLLGSALACSVEVAPAPESSEAATTNAVISVTRSAPAAAPEDARAEAFAGFLRTPFGVDQKSALGLAGLGLNLPAVGSCRKGNAAAPSGLTALELLDAGEVTLAAGGSVTTLAPRAFPSITDSISGVVYTTRDRAAAPLPAASGYTVATSGGSSLEAMSGEAQAPALLSDVTLGGEPLASIESVKAHGDLALGWAPGASGDRVYVEIEAGDTSTCTFADAAGRGTLPASVLPSSGTAAVSVHRVREAAFTDAGLARGALRFDFELSASVTFE
jgi:hypothetical protein